MRPESAYITIDKNIEKIKDFINEVIIVPKHTLTKWATVTNQTPAAKIGYIGQHLVSLITGVQGTGTGARGNDLADGSEVKSCNKVDQADKCKNCESRVMRFESKCPHCGSTNIERKDDSKWLFSIHDENELNTYKNLNRIVLLLMDYPNFKKNDFMDVRITAFEIYPKEERMSVFNELISTHYFKNYLPKKNAKKKTNPMNLHPWSFQFYKCNPVKIFECTIKNIDTTPSVIIDNNVYVKPDMERNESLQTIPMPSMLLRAAEWTELLKKSNYKKDIEPLIVKEYLEKEGIRGLSKTQFSKLSLNKKAEALPFLNEELRNIISLRPVAPVRQKKNYKRI